MSASLAAGARDSAMCASRARRVLAASLVGTSIEFFDFFAHAIVTALAFPKLFLSPGDLGLPNLQALAMFALAFFARPLGAAVFGHPGCRGSRKSTLVLALLTVGTGRVLVGLLPSYTSAGVLAPALLALFRLAEGVALEGEWGGALLRAKENASPGWRAWYGMLPKLGALIGFVSAAGAFLLLSASFDEESFLAWGWRVPFFASALLVAVGLYVRRKVTQAPELAHTSGTRVSASMWALVRAYPRSLALATIAAAAPFVMVYTMTVFTMSWATSRLGVSWPQMLAIQMLAVLLAGLLTPLATAFAARWSSRGVTMAATLACSAFGFSAAPLLGSANGGAFFTVAGLALAGVCYAPLGTALADLFPTPVRYAGLSLAANLAGVLGASLLPYIAARVAQTQGLAAVGYYLSATSLLSFVALARIRSPK